MIASTSHPLSHLDMWIMTSLKFPIWACDFRYIRFDIRLKPGAKLISLKVKRIEEGSCSLYTSSQRFNKPNGRVNMIQFLKQLYRRFTHRRHKIIFPILHLLKSIHYSSKVLSDFRRHTNYPLSLDLCLDVVIPAHFTLGRINCGLCLIAIFEMIWKRRQGRGHCQS